MLVVALFFHFYALLIVMCLQLRFILPQPFHFFLLQAARSIPRVNKHIEDEAAEAANKVQMRLLALQDNIQNYREEYDFVVSCFIQCFCWLFCCSRGVYFLLGAVMCASVAACCAHTFASTLFQFCLTSISFLLIYLFQSFPPPIQ